MQGQTHRIACRRRHEVQKRDDPKGSHCRPAGTAQRRIGVSDSASVVDPADPFTHCIQRGLRNFAFLFDVRRFGTAGRTGRSAVSTRGRFTAARTGAASATPHGRPLRSRGNVARRQMMPGDASENRLH